MSENHDKKVGRFFSLYHIKDIFQWIDNNIEYRDKIKRLEKLNKR